MKFSKSHHILCAAFTVISNQQTRPISCIVSYSVKLRLKDPKHRMGKYYLAKLVDDINLKNKDTSHIQYIYADKYNFDNKAIENFKHYAELLGQPAIGFHGGRCAERYMCNELNDQFAKYGDNLIVNGNTICHVFPLSRYKNKTLPSKIMAMPQLALFDDIVSFCPPACNHCISAKDARLGRIADSYAKWMWRNELKKPAVVGVDSKMEAKSPIESVRSNAIGNFTDSKLNLAKKARTDSVLITLKPELVNYDESVEAKDVLTEFDVKFKVEVCISLTAKKGLFSPRVIKKDEDLVELGVLKSTTISIAPPRREIAKRRFAS